MMSQGITDSKALPKHSSFAGDIFKLVSGTASSHVIGVAAAPLLARLFSPESFGVLALFIGAVATIALVGCFRYELAIPLAESDLHAAHIVWLCVFLALLTTALAVLVILFTGDALWTWVNAPALKLYRWLIPANVFLSSIFSILTSWNMRKRQFGRLTVLEVVSRISISGSQIAVAFAGFTNAGTLIVTTVFGAFLTTAILSIQTCYESAPLLLAGLKWQPIVAALARYCRFPKFSAGAALLNAVSAQLPTVLLSKFFSVATAGQYSFGNRLLRLPGQLIGTTFSQAFFPRAVESKLAGTLGGSVEVALAYLTKLSLFPCLLFALIGKDLFVVVFGQKWAEAGVFTQILSLWLFTWFISSPLSTVFVVLEQQHFEFGYQIVTLASRLGSLLLGAALGSARLALLLFGASGMLLYGSYCAAIIVRSGASPRKILKLLASSLLFSIPATLIVLTTMYYAASPVTVLAVSFVLLTMYYVALLRDDPVARRLLRKLAGKLLPAAQAISRPTAQKH